MHELLWASALVFWRFWSWETISLWLITCPDTELQEKVGLEVNPREDSKWHSSKLVNHIQCGRMYFQTMITEAFLVRQNIFRSLSFPHQERESVFPPLVTEWNFMGEIYLKWHCVTLRQGCQEGVASAWLCFNLSGHSPWEPDHHIELCRCSTDSSC